MKILVVDDDPRLRDLVALACHRAGYAVITAANGAQALTHAQREAPDLIVLDVGLPEMDGLQVCRQIRTRSQVPILFLSAHADEVDRILGLEMGADDYVTKPFSPRELLARIRAILKRSQPAAPTMLRHGLIRLNPDQHVCTVGPVSVTLTAAEMTLLAHLMQRPTLVHPRGRLIDQLWPGTDMADRTLDSHLRNLRHKLAEAGCPDAIDTLHGIGIRMGPCLG